MVETILYNFTRINGGSGPTGLILDEAGNIDGAALGGQEPGGLVFGLRPSNGSWGFAVLYNFSGKADGEYPLVPLVQDKAGHLYSTTQYGGTSQTCYSGCGVVFEMTP